MSDDECQSWVIIQCITYIIIFFRFEDMQGNTDIMKLSGHFEIQGHVGSNSVICVNLSLKWISIGNMIGPNSIIDMDKFNQFEISDT